MSNYRVHVEDSHDVLATHVYVYQDAGGGAQFILQSDGSREVLKQGQSYSGPPTYVIPWDYKEALLDALMPQRKDVDDMVLDTLEREQGRVDQFIEFLTARDDPMDYMAPMQPTRGPDAT